jgi:glycosyltransferase involved in cell wall biosynthesis
MFISGFSFIKNAVTFDYPIVASIQSILPVVDEYVIAVGNSTDATLALIESIKSPKIKIITTTWNDNNREGGAVLAEETNKALAHINPNADWAFYLQGDECLHEKDYPAIRAAMQQHLTNPSVEGLVFKYLHFYGNYNYVGMGRRWYRTEVRIIRNKKSITSWRDAQGFRHTNGEKIQVKKIDAHIYHYGWVKPPKISQQKALYFNQINNKNYIATAAEQQADFDYHNIDKLAHFTGSHPAVMASRLQKVNWHFEFNTKNTNFKKMKFKHKISYLIEQLTGYRLGEYKNYKLI